MMSKHSFGHTDGLYSNLDTLFGHLCLSECLNDPSNYDLDILPECPDYLPECLDSLPGSLNTHSLSLPKCLECISDCINILCASLTIHLHV